MMAVCTARAGERMRYAQICNKFWASAHVVDIQPRDLRDITVPYCRTCRTEYAWASRTCRGVCAH